MYNFAAQNYFHTIHFHSRTYSLRYEGGLRFLVDLRGISVAALLWLLVPCATASSCFSLTWISSFSSVPGKSGGFRTDLNCDEYLVISLSSLLAINMLPFLLVISYGLGSKGVVNLFSLSCCTRTVSLVCSFEGLAFLLLSA